MAKAKAVFYLTETSLILQTEKAILSRVTFSETLVKDKQVVDSDGLTSLLTQELKPLLKKASNTVVILGEGILFQSSVTIENERMIAQEALLASLPFPKEQTAEKTIVTGKKIYILATNKEYYLSLVSACLKVGIEVLAVLPFSLFSDEAIKDKLSSNALKSILSKPKLYAVGDFLKETQAHTTTSESEESSQTPPDTAETASPVREAPYQKEVVWNTPRLLVVLGFLMVLTFLMGALIYTQISSKQMAAVVAQEENEPTETPTPIPQTEIAKSELKVEVQNGSGTAGQAGKVKAILEGIEYATIDTTNAESTDHTKTEVVFSDKVSSKQQQELKTLLLETFTAVSTKTDSQSEFDILIITGEEK